MKNAKTIAFMLMSIVVASGCIGQSSVQNNGSSNNSITGSTVAINDLSYQAAEEIGSFQLINEQSIKSVDQYTQLGDYTNAAIDVLKSKMNMDIPKLDTTQAGYEKMSKFVSKWAPLVNGYNNLVLSAKAVERGNDTSLQNFYKSSAVFGAEFGLIYYTVFSGVTYEGVGIVYRATGMQNLAFRCGPCVSVILSQANWAVRGALVEGSAKDFDEVMNIVYYLSENKIKIEEFKLNPDKIVKAYEELNITLPSIPLK